MKTSEMEKNQLIEQVCSLEKNNEMLEEKLKEIVKHSQALEDKERRYKEEIHRINSSLDILGTELSAERSSKKNIQKEYEKFKEQSKKEKE